MADFNVICDRSGFKCKRSECVKEWTGLIVKKEFADTRHPMDFFKVPPERRFNRETRPEQAVVEVDPTLAPDWSSL